MFTVIAALRAGGVGSCWDLSTNSMSNLHLIPPHVCLLPHWVIEMLSSPALLLDSPLPNISLTFLWESQCQGLFSWFVSLLLLSPSPCFGCRAFSLDMMSSVCGSAAQGSQQTLSFPLHALLGLCCIFWQCLDLLDCLILGFHHCLSIAITKQAYFRKVLTLIFRFDCIYISQLHFSWEV